MSIARTLVEVRKLLRGNSPYRLESSAFESRAYPLDLQFTLDREADYYEPKDAQGIPQRHYASAGVQYSPTRVAAYGFATFNDWLRTKSEKSRTRFQQSADWFLGHKSGEYRYNFPWDDMPAGWLSAMAQGEAISVLARAFEVFGEKRYRDHAILSAELFQRTTPEGGVITMMDGNTPFLEEYPHPKPRHALNGALYAMIGLEDLRRLSDATFKNINGPAFVAGLERVIDRYDLGYWSSYDLHSSPDGHRNPATIDYHAIHIAQLHYLGVAFKSEKLLAQSRRWREYSESLLNRCKAFTLKLKYRSRVKAQR